MESFTRLENISVVVVHYMNGEKEEIKVDAVVRDGIGRPLWIVHTDIYAREVIIPWPAIRSVTILARNTPELEHQPGL